jgi:hypothetical protein
MWALRKWLLHNPNSAGVAQLAGPAAVAQLPPNLQVSYRQKAA